MFETTRAVIGELGCRLLTLAAVPLHVATVVLAYRWYGGVEGVIAASLSSLVPILPEAYWLVRVYLEHGYRHWYVVAIGAYPIVWFVFLLGGVAFGPWPKPPPGE